MSERSAEKVLKVKGQSQGRDQTECYNGAGMHFDGVALRYTCITKTMLN